MASHKSPSPVWRPVLRGPAWRAELVERRMNGDVALFASRDAMVQRLLAYRSALSEGGQADDQLLAAVEELSRDVARTQAVRILVMGRTPADQIAVRIGVGADVVEAWEAIYFDVRASLHAQSWISTQVLGPELEAGNEEFVAQLKVAYCCGPAGARAVLDAASRAPVTAAERLFDRQVKLQQKFEQAIVAPIDTDARKVRFVVDYARLQLQNERLELDKQKLTLRCARELQRHQQWQHRERNAQRRRAETEERRRRKAEKRLQKAQHLELARKRWKSWQLSEREAASTRASASPLAQLTWTHSADSVRLVISGKDLPANRQAEQAAPVSSAGIRRVGAA